MSKIFLTSDLHFGHDKEFVWKVRGYDSVEDMNEKQVQKWNSIVAEEDDVYVVGDLMLGETTNIEYLKLLKGKLHIVLGNHDTSKRAQMYKELPNVVEIAEVGIKLKYQKHNFVLTHYPMVTGNFEKESLKQMTLNLYGHTHQPSNFYNDAPFMYHVGVDSHDGYPVLLDDIITEMHSKMREINEMPQVEHLCNTCLYAADCKDCPKIVNCKKYKLNPVNKENLYNG